MEVASKMAFERAMVWAGLLMVLARTTAWYASFFVAAARQVV